MSKKIMDREFFEGLAKSFAEKAGLQVDNVEAMENVIKAHLEHVSEELGEALADSKEGVSIELPGYISYTASYRENNGVGNYGMGVEVGEEIQRQLTDDEDLIDEE